MASILLDVLEPELKERDKKRERDNLYIYVQDGDMLPEKSCKASWPFP